MGKVLVTGGAGFIGSHIVDAMVQEGHQVVVLDDLSSGVRENLPSGVTLEVRDVRDLESRDFVRNFSPDILIHAAAQMSVRRSMEDPTFDVDVNVKGITNLLQAFDPSKMPYVVFISTGGAFYGDQVNYPAHEDDPAKQTSIYGLSKNVSEQYLDFWHRTYSLPYSVLRLGNVFGPRQNPHGEAGVVAIFVRNLLKGKSAIINGNGEQTRDYIYVGDVVSAVRAVVSKRVQGTFNIGLGEETSVNQLFDYIVSALKLDVKPSYGPAKDGEQMRSSISPKRAGDTFGWKPQVDLKRAIELTCEWFVKNP